MTINIDMDMTIDEPSEIDMAVTQDVDNISFELGAEAIAVKNHAVLENRDKADQHPISAITGLANILSTIPTKTSQLANDSGYVKASDIPTVPTKTSQLQNDSGYITSSAIPTVPTKTSQLTNDSGFITDAGVTSFNGSTGAVTYTAPVTSVNGQTGAVTVTEGLTPLIGTAENILPSQVSSAIAEGRDVAISLTNETFGTLMFTSFNKAVTLNVLVANTIAFYNSTLYLFELDGALTYDMWAFNYRELAQIEDLADYVPTIRTVNNKALSSNITLSASDVGALPNTTVIPTKTSDLTNDSGFITSVPVSSVNSKTGAVVLTASEVGALPDDTFIPTKTSDLINDSDFMSGMTILLYGHSTWQDFITAYTKKHVVYCRASSQSNPATGSQTRLAFMAYVNNADSPTEVEFQYYRSVSTHTTSQQGDQVYIYKLTSAGTWTVTVREASVKVAAGTGITGTYSRGTMTLALDGTLPTKTSDLTNDSGFITGAQVPSNETDPTVPSWAKASTKPSYTASEVGALPSSTTIPTKTSQLTNDSGYITDAGVTSFNGSTGAVTYTAPVTSVNGQTGAVTVTEGLAPLIGTTSTVTATEVKMAVEEGRDVCISYTHYIYGVLEFTSFNVANSIHSVVSHTIVNYNSTILCVELIGVMLSEDTQEMWLCTVDTLASSSDIPTKTSDLTNDSGYITLADLPIYDGTVN